MRTSLVIPCYNEQESIRQLCERLEALVQDIGSTDSIEVIFVDDGSTDRTLENLASHATNLPYRIVRHERNRGLGAALRTGIRASDGEEIVTLDSDCTYDPGETPRLLEALRAGASVVTGSPYHPEGHVEGVAVWRLVLSRSLSHLYSLVLPVRLNTYTSMFRAYRRSALPDLDALDDGFLAVTQLLVEPILRGLTVVEVPTTLHVRRYGQSKMSVMRVGLSHLRYIGRVVRMRHHMSTTATERS